MGWFRDDSDVTQLNNEYQNRPKHEASVSHELLSGAAAFEAADLYAKHCAESGKPVSHARAKEILAGFSGAFVDREVETHGLDYIDREKAKRDSQKHYDQIVDNEYGQY